MSASALRYQPSPDRNEALRERIVALAHRHRRYGAGMIYLKLRQAGMSVNHKRVERPYGEARLLSAITWQSLRLNKRRSFVSTASRLAGHQIVFE